MTLKDDVAKRSSNACSSPPITLQHAQVDDPLEAVAVHAFCGIWGMIAVGFFAVEAPVHGYYGEGTDFGVIMGGEGSLLGAQLIGVLVIAAWTIAHMYVFFSIIHRFGFLRVPPEVETDGLDGEWLTPDVDDGGSCWSSTSLMKRC